MPYPFGPPSLPLSNPVRTPLAAAKKAVAKKVVAPVSQTLAQVANQRVNQQLAPQIAAQNSFNARQASVIQSFANALLGKLQPIAGQVGQDYDKAINQQGALSGQAAQYLSAANPTGRVQELLASAGAPQAQQDQIAGQLGQTFTGGAGVLAFTGGAIPGSQMAADKAAAQAQAAQLPGLAALRGQQDLSSALWQQGQDRQKLEATRPALYQEAAQNIRENNAARNEAAATASYRATTQAEKQREFGITTNDRRAAAAEKTRQFEATQESKKAAADFLNWYRTEGLNQKTTAINEKAREFGVTAGQRDKQIAISKQKANLAEKNANKPKDHSIAGGGIVRVYPDGTTKVIRKPTVSSAKTKTGQAADFPNLTKAQVLHLRSGIANAFSGVTEKKDASGKVTREALPAVDYQTAIDEAVKHGYSRAGATKMANRFYMPGQRGRPGGKGAGAPTGVTGPVG